MKKIIIYGIVIYDNNQEYVESWEWLDCDPYVEIKSNSLDCWIMANHLNVAVKRIKEKFKELKLKGWFCSQYCKKLEINIDEEIWEE